MPLLRRAVAGGPSNGGDAVTARADILYQRLAGPVWQGLASTRLRQRGC